MRSITSNAETAPPPYGRQYSERPAVVVQYVYMLSMPTTTGQAVLVATTFMPTAYSTVLCLNVMDVCPVSAGRMNVLYYYLKTE
jgi:hypothetical protein